MHARYLKGTVFGQFELFNSDGSYRWKTNIVLQDNGKYSVEDNSEYSLFSHPLVPDFDTMGEAINAFIEVEMGILDATFGPAGHRTPYQFGS